jgi:hypothetical protein
VAIGCTEQYHRDAAYDAHQPYYIISKRSAIPLCDKKIKTDQYEKKKDNMPLTSKESSRE